jgi:hypothetical protein
MAVAQEKSSQFGIDFPSRALPLPTKQQMAGQWQMVQHAWNSVSPQLEVLLLVLCLLDIMLFAMPPAYCLSRRARW